MLKLVDFGVAKLGDSGLNLTGTAQTLGSPLYMSPEQINAPKTIDGRSDIWALGVALYELLTGTTPFQAGTLMQLTTNIFLRPPAPLAHHRPEIPSGLTAVIEGCLEKDRARRWRSVGAFAAALAPYAQPRSPHPKATHGQGFAGAVRAIPPSSGHIVRSPVVSSRPAIAARRSSSGSRWPSAVARRFLRLALASVTPTSRRR